VSRGQVWRDSNTNRSRRLVRVVGFVHINKTKYVVVTTVNSDKYRECNSVVAYSRFHNAFTYYNR
jgi:hypothetical protein